MKRPFRIGAATISILIMLAAVLVSGGCAVPDGGGFAVFLTKADIAPAQMTGLSQVELSEQPTISMRDIVTYNSQTHELKLSAGSYERICNLDVPVRGKSFVVCADWKPVYWGAFWTPISSISFDGVTIWKPYNKEQPRVLTFELGYPSPSFYGGNDPRNNPELLKPLELAGKLITKHTVNSINALPHSMKGYELYSWSRDGQWYFTLITGTNRDKTTEEIISGEDYISEAGLVKICATGTDALKSAFSKIQGGEQIFWLAQPRPGSTAGTVNFALPPAQTVNNLKEYARQRGLELQIAQ
ncbi:MAG: hypothetical protein A2Z02_03920 [Chloroflexi bacterium RBG_16_48_7]|nr:MAG: hypothetical protein A2Z02_03920 [Chloroflexi bacterium RBG_16_48_7]